MISYMIWHRAANEFISVLLFIFYCIIYKCCIQM
jgi:hypothetical protein